MELLRLTDIPPERVHPKTVRVVQDAQNRHRIGTVGYFAEIGFPTTRIERIR
jgi:hypothetical protein